ncbi:hypothetical protein DFH09DRAFT_1179687 [Mycena vulgaris]|nr:hypothetical protein DFH09DRAFT_1179687 [Mycena vulgaris]
MFPTVLRILLQRTSPQRARRWLQLLYRWVVTRIRRVPLLAWAFIVKLISEKKARGPSGHPRTQSVDRDSCFLPSHDLGAGAQSTDFMHSSLSPANDISAPGARKGDEIQELEPSMHITSRSHPVDGAIRADTTSQLRLLSSVGLYPMAPGFLDRYERRETIKKLRPPLTLAPQSRAFPLDCPAGWKAHVHPEGARYYFHETKRIFTDAHLHDRNAFESLTRFLDLIEEFFLGNGIGWEKKIDLVLDLVKEDSEGYSCKYYFADHHARTIFWYDEFETDRLDHCYEVYGAISPQHIEIELSAQYWLHCELFPTALPFTLELVGELRDILVYNIGDAMTSAAMKTIPFSGDDLLKMLTVVDSMKENVGSNDGSGCVLGRFMSLFAASRFYNFSGEPCARLDQRQSVYGHVPTRSFVIRMVSPLMFNAPLSHLESLQDLYVDEVVRHGPWRRTTERLCTEWQELTLYATVLLNANIAFLSIPTVTLENVGNRSAAQISTYISVIASLASVFLGLSLMLQYRTHKEDTPKNAATFLWRHSNARFGFESLAILYSLPFAFLMWGTITFLVAFLTMCFQLSDTTTRLLVGCFLFFITLGTLACFVRGDIAWLQLVWGVLRCRTEKRRGLSGITIV